MHAALRPDGAGWQSAGETAVPADISPILLSPFLLPPGSKKLINLGSAEICLLRRKAV